MAIYPLVRDGEGWREIADPDPAVKYEAYRVDCEDPDCPAPWRGPSSPHSHIVLDPDALLKDQPDA